MTELSEDGLMCEAVPVFSEGEQIDVVLLRQCL